MTCVALAIWCWDARSAVACSGPWGVQARSVFPPDGAIDVPLNVQPSITYRGDVGSLDTYFHVRPVGGLPVELERESSGEPQRLVSSARLLSNLDPDTTYEMLDRVMVPCNSWPDECILPGFQVVSTFTTGSSTDDTSPSFAGLGALSSQFLPASEEDTCGFYSSVTFMLTWSPASDDRPDEWVRYNVYDGANRRQIALLDSTHVTGEALCSGMADFWPLEGLFSGPTGDYYVRAVDAAGNEDDNDARMATVACEAPGVDAGPGDMDAGVAAPDGGHGADPSDPTGCGCAAADRRDPAGSIPLWVGLVGCWLLWRRRNATSALLGPDRGQ